MQKILFTLDFPRLDFDKLVEHPFKKNVFGNKYYTYKYGDYTMYFVYNVPSQKWRYIRKYGSQERIDRMTNCVIS